MTISAVRRTARPALAPLALIATLPLLALPAAAGPPLWSLEARFTTLADPNIYLNVGPLGSEGNAQFSVANQAAKLDFTAQPSAFSNPQLLKSSASVKLELLSYSTTQPGWASAELIGQARSSIDDTLTVQGAAGFSGGFLQFDWGMHGQMRSSLEGTDPNFPFLANFGWEYYLKSELFVLSDGLQRLSVSEQVLTRATLPTPDGAKNFLDYLPWAGDELPYHPTATLPAVLDVDQPGGSQTVRVPVAPGTPLALSINLYSGVNLALFNVDYSGLMIDGAVEFNNTATLTGVRLLHADGSAYAGAWTLDSALGASYPLLAVPEPASAWLWLIGAVGLAGVFHARDRSGETGAVRRTRAAAAGLSRGDGAGHRF